MRGGEYGDPQLRPLPLWKSCLLFVGLGAVGFVLSTLGAPWLVDAFGVSRTRAMSMAAVALFAIPAGLASTLYVREGRRPTWSGLKNRFRIHDITRREWWMVLLGVLIVDATYIGLQVTRKPIAGLFSDWMKDPYRVYTTVDPAGDYLGLILFAGLILFNVISEEMLWRGYALPRQELQHGRRTWWIHGLLWTSFHWFKPWDLLALLPGALVYGWLSTRTKSMIPGLVLHLGLNGLGILLLANKTFG